MRRRGFTLIELLVVITIIVIASSIIFVVGGGGDGASLTSSQRIIAGIAQGARGQAILKNARTRLIIYGDTGGTRDDEKYLRYFGIVYFGEDENGTTGWIAATQGTYLPEGIYFEPDSSLSSGVQTMNLDYPFAVAKPEVGELYYYYEFNPNGTMATTPNDFNNSRLIFRAGTLKPNGNTLELDFVSGSPDEEKQYIGAGLIFRRVGTTTPIDDPEEALNL